jgi:CrcB protein
MPSIINIVAVAIGGACGAVARYLLIAMPWSLHGKYYYTAVVNISGCLIIGVLFACLNRWGVSQTWRDFLMVGCLGGYTTYSSFSLDAMQLLQQGRWSTAVIYLSVTLIGGLIASALGWFGTDKILKYL